MTELLITLIATQVSSLAYLVWREILNEKKASERHAFWVSREASIEEVRDLELRTVVKAEKALREYGKEVGLMSNALAEHLEDHK